MNMGKEKSSRKYLFLYIFIVSFYCLFTTRYGFENWDTGYIPSFSWRVLNGQDIYEDFLYKGPPLTIYFHSLFFKFLPESGQFLFIRIVNYLMFSIQVFFAVTGFFNFYGNKIKFNKWTIMSIGFITSLLNFSPYPWPTTDGLFFASIAFYLFSKLKSEKNNFGILFFISLFCMFSAFTKQSFYLIPIIFLTGIFWIFGLKKASFFAIYCIFLGILFLIWLTSITTLNNFLELTTGETSITRLLYPGFIDYIKIPSNYYFIYALLLLATIGIYFRIRKTKFSFTALYKSASLVLLFFTIVLCFSKLFLEASRVAMLSCFFGLLSKNVLFLGFKKSREFVPIVMILGIAWCCSISLGYAYPILFSTGIILSILILFEDEIKLIRTPYVLTIVMISLCCIAYSYNLKPYREENFLNLSYNLETVSPKLKGIKTNKENLEKLVELKNLVTQFGPNYIVAPNIPMTHYLFNTQSVLPADWVINSEINRNPDLFIKLASNKSNYIFLEKSFLKGEELMPEKMEDFSVVATYIYNNFIKIGESNQFIIYNSISLDEKLPEIN